MHAGGVQFDETGSLAEVVASGTQSAHLVSKPLERDSRNNWRYKIMLKTSSRSRKQFRTSDDRQLKDLAGVGPATLEDLALLGVHSVAQLAEQKGTELYERLCSVTGVQHDVCCLDVFRCAVAQARDPELPEEQRNWWYWSRLRKKKASAWSLQ